MYKNRSLRNVILVFLLIIINLFSLEYLSFFVSGEELDSSLDYVGNFYVGVNTIDRTINVGEEVFENIAIVNTAKSNASIGITTNMSVLVDKELIGIISINNKVEIPPFESRNVIIRLYGLKEGIYLGNIYFFGERIIEKWIDKSIEESGYNISIANTEYVKEITNRTYILPVKVVVKGIEPKLVNLKVVLDKQNVLAGDKVGFEVSVFNLGSLSKYEIGLFYEIIDAEGNVIATKEENVELKNNLIINRNVELPGDIESGEYELVVRATYDYKIVTEKQSFKVGPLDVSYSPFIGLGKGFSIFVSNYLPLILTVLFVSILIIIGAYYFVYLRKRLFEEKIAEIKKKSIYVFPDFEKLPKSRFAYIGLIADSPVKTYLDHTQLNRHILIAGGTGAGKSVSGMVIVEELLKKGNYPIIVFDPVGQWAGFVKKNEDKKMMSLYKKFGIKEGRRFDANIIEITDDKGIDIINYLKREELTILKLDKLSPMKLDKFIEESLDKIYRANLNEKSNLKSLIVLDEVHRLLPKYGGKRAHIKLEQAVREFRKWGIGLLMISQVLTDFKGAIRGNIGTEIQMRTLYEGDIKRVKERHGSKYSSLIAKLPIGVGMVESSEYNKGVPYFVEFRPLLHSPLKISEGELNKYLKTMEF